nr:aldo/keto reductase [Actinomycetota bacterium]
MEARRLGRTGHRSTVGVLGGAAFWAATPDEATAGLELALARGVNHLDIAPQYGAAEDAVGPHV